ncbi:MAG: VWA domain-containing protein [Pseudomonadota bacterium]
MERVSRACFYVALVALSVAACSRQPAPEATTAPRAGEAAKHSRTDAAAYYASLVQRFGGDYDACPAAVNAQVGSCADGKAAAPGPTRVLLMLDASGSMAARLGASTKMDAARSALTEFVEGLGGETQVALRVYGHTGDNTPAGKPESCRGTALVHPFSPLDVAGFRSAVASFQPRGWTPIATALQAAAGDFPKDTGGRNVVYLVSDGEETCGGDPAAAARALRESGIAVTVNVIGFGVDGKAAAQLRPIAAAGGGEYLAADTASALIALFNRRIADAHKRYNCASREQHGAYNTTSATHHARYNCLSAAAHREYNDISRTVHLDRNAGRVDAELRDGALELARAKRDRIIEPARAERDAAIDAGRSARDATLGQERAVRDERLDHARRERPAR